MCNLFGVDYILEYISVYASFYNCDLELVQYSITNTFYSYVFESLVSYLAVDICDSLSGWQSQYQ